MTAGLQELGGSRTRALRAFWDSSVGKKAVMAVTGLIGIGYVILHMIGNLQVFQGAERLNAYAAMLHGPLNELLWVARVILVAAIVLHVVAAWQLTRRDQAARPVDYRMREPQVSTTASRTMRWGGVLLLVFIVVHILHFTTGTVRPTGSFTPGDVYGNVTGSFQLGWVTLFYVAAMVALGFHLYHGAWSSVRTLGAANPARNLRRRPVAILVAVVVAGGFALVPLAVYFGLLR
jgi:succinate dehydrogenase / fumarate reductase cytochrome b subunit